MLYVVISSFLTKQKQTMLLCSLIITHKLIAEVCTWAQFPGKFNILDIRRLK